VVAFFPRAFGQRSYRFDAIEQPSVSMLLQHAPEQFAEQPDIVPQWPMRIGVHFRRANHAVHAARPLQRGVQPRGFRLASLAREVAIGEPRADPFQTTS